MCMCLGAATDIISEGMEKLENLEGIESLENLQKIDKNLVKQYLKDYIPDLLNFAIQLVLAVLLYIIGKHLISFARKVVRKTLERRGVDLGVRQFLDSILKYFLFIVLWLMILTLFGITTASVVAVVGSAGLTLGLALQGSLENFAGGVLILLLRPFRVGDYIVSNASGYEGTVQEITTFYTKLTTIDNRVIMLPNGSLAGGAIVNATGQLTRRIDLNVGISYDSDLHKAKELLAYIVAKESRVLTDQPVDIYVSELAESSVEMGCRFWVKSEDYWPVRWDTLEAVKLIFDEHGIVIPFRQVDVNIKNS